MSYTFFLDSQQCFLISIFDESLYLLYVDMVTSSL